jgi:hypothetical protein
MKRVLCRTIAAVVAAAACATNAFAQPDSRPPSGAVFGGIGSPAGEDRLNLTVDLAEAYDQDVLAHAGERTFSVFEGNGLYSTLTPQLDFNSGGGRMQVGLTAGSNARYYADLRRVMVTSHSVGIGLRAQVKPGTTLFLNQGVTYSPALFSGLFAAVAEPAVGDIVPPGSNYLFNTTRGYSYSTSASLTQKITGRAALEFIGSLRHSAFTVSDPSFSNVDSAEVGGRFLYSMTRNVKLRLGHRFRHGQYSGLPRSVEQNLEIGIDYARPLSRTRRTTLTFNLGPTIAEGPATSGPSPEVRRQYTVIADVAVNHQVGRTWNLRGTYRRGMGYFEGLQTPSFTGAYAATAGGFLNRRADLFLTAAYSTGESTLIQVEPQFTTYTGDARLRIALSTHWAAYVEYLYYYYQMGEGIKLPTGVPSGLTRNGVRTGLTLWIPMRNR